jgi:transposase
MGLKHCRLKINQRKRLIECFVLEVTARSAADVLGIHPNTAALFYRKLREIIAERIADETPFDGEIEMDESYFGGVRKGKRGRGAAGKVPVFGLLKRGGKVYTAVVPDTKGSTLKAIITAKSSPIASFTPTATVLIMCWMSPSLNTTGLITPSYSQTSTIISTESKTSGIRPNGSCENTTASLQKTFPCS